MEVKMSSYQQNRIQKRKQKYQKLNEGNDTSNQEFDSYYHRCLLNKKQRLDQKLLNTEDFSGKAKLAKSKIPSVANNSTNDELKQHTYKWSHTSEDEYQEWYTNEEIDRAFEEAERWSDF